MSRWMNSVLLIAILALFAAAPAVSADPPPAPAGEKQAAPALDVKEITLDNGLRIFVLERTSSPTFAGLFQFGVGGAMDPKGASGIAHLLEHMMFKGTTRTGTLDWDKEAPMMKRLTELWNELQREMDREADPFREADAEKIEALKKEITELSAEQKKLIVKNEYDEIMTRAGGVSMNAGTGNDTTTYFIQLPANRLELWFRMESERLLDPVFREFYSERDVVVEERRQVIDNSPGGTMSEALDAVMFAAHPYGTPVIGWPRDITRVVREDAEKYFKTYYSPGNCVMVLAGDLKTAEVERLAKKYLGAWEPQVLPPLPVTDEPEQKGERRRVVEFDAEPRIRMSWVTVPTGHDDSYALTVLSRILGGLWSSRLDRNLVQRDRIATRIGTGHNDMTYAGYFSAYGSPEGDHTVADIEAAVEREIAKIHADGVTAEELERAKISTEVGRVRRLKSNLGQAFQIAQAVRLSGGTDYIREYEKKINAVTAEQVRDVARRYLQPSRKNVVVLSKNEQAGAGMQARGAGVQHQRGGAPGKRGAKHSPGFREAMAMIRAAEPVELKIPVIGKDLERVELPSGITVFIKEDRSAPSISMEFAWLGGSNTLPVKDLAPFTLASDLLIEGGTENLDPIALQERMDELGMNFSYFLGSTAGGGGFWSLKRNFEESFDLAMEMLMKPRLDPGRLEVLKGQHIDRMKRRWDSASTGSSLIMRHVLNGDHPRLGYTASRKEVEAIEPADVRRMWRRYLGSDNLYVTAVGDFDSKEMLEFLQRRLGAWRKAEDRERKFITRDPVVRPGVYLVEKEIPQPSIRFTHHIKVDRTAPLADHAALEILNDILGGSGFRSRLMERLRSDEGLTYGIYSSLYHDGRKGQPGSIRISYQTKKDSVAYSINSVMEEFRRILAEEVSGPEVEEQIEGWRNRFIFRYTSDFFIVSRLMSAELDDRPYDYDRRLLEAIQKVTPADVLRVAKKYLDPGKLTIAVLGALTDEDRKSLDDRFGLTVFDRETVFKGGYEKEPEPAGAS